MSHSQVCTLPTVCAHDQVPIPAGSLIGEYVGEVLPEQDWQARQVRSTPRTTLDHVIMMMCGFTRYARNNNTLSVQR